MLWNPTMTVRILDVPISAICAFGSGQRYKHQYLYIKYFDLTLWFQWWQSNQVWLRANAHTNHAMASWNWFGFRYLCLESQANFCKDAEGKIAKQAVHFPDSLSVRNIIYLFFLDIGSPGLADFNCHLFGMFIRVCQLSRRKSSWWFRRCFLPILHQTCMGCWNDVDCLCLRLWLWRYVVNGDFKTSL